MPNAMPIKYGDGREIGDIVAQARHATTDALTAIMALLRDADTDSRLRFTIARFVIELGWGRPRQMAAPVVQSPETFHLTAVMQAQFNTFLEQLTDDRDGNGGCDDEPQDDRPAGESRMVPDGA